MAASSREIVFVRLAVLPVLHTPDGTPGAFVTVIVDAENGHVVVNIAVGSLERAEFRGGPKIGTLMKVILWTADDIPGGKCGKTRGVVGRAVMARRVLQVQLYAREIIPTGCVG